MERLLRKARELREQASQQEQQIHQELSEKKSIQQSKLDNLVSHYLCGSEEDTVCSTQAEVVKRMHKKPISMGTLEQMVDRLDDRQLMALGHEHVSENLDRVKHKRDDKEVQKLENLINLLLGAVEVLDAEFRQEHLQKRTVGGVAGNSPAGSLLYAVSHAEAEHWGGGEAAKHLRQRLQEKRREREEQFQKRQEEFYEAQRIKKHHPPPPKVKDDHGFL